MTAIELPEIGSLWYFPPWTNPKWQGAWKVTRIGPAAASNEDTAGDVIVLERVEGPPEDWNGGGQHEYALDSLNPWPGRWERWS